MINKLLAVAAIWLNLEVFAQESSASEPPLKEILMVEVDKEQLLARLKTWPEDPSQARELMTFRVAIGKKEGDKQKEGDHKTPEGIYFTQTIIDGKTLPAKYGSNAIPIDFPNSYDRFLKKTGYGIWLHGVEKDRRISAAKVTEGCVAFYNTDIEFLSDWLKPHQAVVVIGKNAHSLNQPRVLSSVRKETTKWLESWQSRDIDAYIGFYDSQFRHKGRSLDHYRGYKQRVFKSYNEMKVEFSSLRVFGHENYAVAIANQDFDGDGRYRSEGRKVLFWNKQPDGSWKILVELFDSRRLRATEYSNLELSKLAQISPSRHLESEVKKVERF